jgi:lysozyme
MITKSTYEFIRGEEGCRLKAYRDVAGIPTIGWGSTMYEDGTRVKMGDVIDMDKANRLLEWEVKTKAGAVVDCLRNIVLNQNQVDALISLAYNIGVGGFRQSTVLKRVRNNPKDPTIADAFMMWNKITDPVTKKKVVSKGLTLRRKREAKLYFTPI